MADLRKIQKKWQEKWEKAKVFEANPNPSKEKLFVTVPYPYISGSLHIGHARVVTEMDTYSRYWRMAGKNVMFPIAFHISGTPVLGISAAIKNNDKAKVKIYEGYVKNYVKGKEEVKKAVKSFEDPWNIVNFFIPKMKDEFSKLGLAVDWRRSFTSGDLEHQKLVEWQFKKYKEQNYIIQGKYPLLYCLGCENAVGEDDIADGDTNPVDKQEFTLLKFELNDSYIVAGTLRPETMYGQTNMWANPNIEYVKAKVNGETWIISKECAEKLMYQEKNVEIIGKVPGKELIGKKCIAPVIEREIIILPSEFPDANIATGLVTSVPSDAPFDYMALKELQEDPVKCRKYKLNFEEIKGIKLIPIIKSKGYGDFPAVEICNKLKVKSVNDKQLEEATQEIYKAGFHTGIMMDTCGPYNGMKVIQAKELMKKDLLLKNKADVFYETSRSANCRCGGKVIVSILDNQWFLDFNATDWKLKAKEMLQHMEIQPDKYRKQFEDVFEWLDKRPCARRRGLGTRLPFDKEWVIESLSDSTIYMSLYPICYKIREFEIRGEQLTDEFFGFVMLGEGAVQEVAQKTGIAPDNLQALREEFDYWYPNDHRHTFPAHLPNHLSFSIFAHVAVFPRKYWTKKFSFHGMVISGGQKMSKSKGNVVTLLHVNKKYGADTFRAFMCNSTSVESTFDWQEAEMQKMKTHLESVYSLIEGMAKNSKEGELPQKHASFYSKLESCIKEATESISKMNLRDYSRIVLYDIWNAYKKTAAMATEEDIKVINSYAAKKWIALLTPLTPHLAEELWAKIGNKGFVSVAQWPVADESLIDDSAEAMEQLIDQSLHDIRSVLELANVKKPSKVILFVAEPWKYNLVSKLKMEMAKTRDVGQLIRAVMDKEHGQEIAKIVPSLAKNPTKIPSTVLSEEDEFKVLSSSKAFFEKELGLKVEVLKAKEIFESSKAKQAMPSKPAILIE